MRHGDWKLIEFSEDTRCELYNLRRDIGEKHDLSAEHPERVERMAGQLAQWRREVQAIVPRVNVNYTPPATGAETDPAEV